MLQLTICLDSGGEKPLYQQLYESLAAQIRSGVLKAGDRLPGKRALAGQLAVAVNTVDTAYQMLAAEGYLEARQRSGFFVFIQQLEDGRNQRFFSSSRRSSRSQTPSMYCTPRARSYLP